MIHPASSAFAQSGLQMVTTTDLQAAGANGMDVFVYAYDLGGNRSLIHMCLRVRRDSMVDVLRFYDNPGLEVWGSLTQHGMGLAPCPRRGCGGSWATAFVISANGVTVGGLLGRLGTIWENLMRDYPNMFCRGQLQSLRDSRGTYS